MNVAIASSCRHLATLTHLALAAVACIAIVTSPGRVFADDLVPPPWRGEPLTTVAAWDFLTPNGGPPDALLPPPVVGDGGGLPSVTPLGGIIWDPVFNGSWIGNTGGALQFSIPNWIDTEPWKQLWVQITYQPNPTLPPPGLSNILGSIPGGTVSSSFVSANDVLIDPLNNLYHRTEVWNLFPNPYSETFDIFIQPDVVVAQVVVDTISAPEPSTLCLAALGLTLVGVCRWRRKR